MTQLPILYSFRRCPYAIRGRLALQHAGVSVILREINLKDKAPEFLETSPKGTVPVLVLPDGTILDESLDVLDYAWEIQKKKGLWLETEEQTKQYHELLETLSTQFSKHMYRYKYSVRIDEHVEIAKEKALCLEYLEGLDKQLESDYFLGDKMTRADIAIIPFVRQFYVIDREEFMALPFKNLIAWSKRFLDSKEFYTIMQNVRNWYPDQEPFILETIGETA